MPITPREGDYLMRVSHQVIHTVVGVAMVASSSMALGDETLLSAKAWHTSPHIGYAVSDRSSTGFAQVGGTLVFADLTHPVTPRLELGLRSTAQGGRSSGREFNRIGAGPLCSYQVAKGWLVQSALSYFNESGLGENQQASYWSRGIEAQLGWERLWTLDRRVTAALGGFASYHQGGVTALPNSTGAISAPGQRWSTGHHNLPFTNEGWSHGMELALRLSM